MKQYPNGMVGVIFTAQTICILIATLWKALFQRVWETALALHDALPWRPEKNPRECAMEQVRRENRSALDLL